MLRRRSLIRPMIAAGWLCALSCSLAIDTSDVDQGCGPGRKLCAGKCVEQDDKGYGCSRSGCAPCPLANAIPRCAGETCVVEACLFGFDCPEVDAGCLTNVLVDPNHCGRCDTACKSWQSCSNGTCVDGQAGSGD